MLCATCLAIFAETYTEVWHDGSHHRCEADLEKAAGNGCYLCSELLVQYVEAKIQNQTDPDALAGFLDRNFHTQRRLEKQTGFITFHLRIITDEYGDLYFWFEETRSCSVTYFLIRNHAVQAPSNHEQYLQTARQDLADTPWLVRDDGFDLPANLTADSTGEPEVARIASKWLANCLGRHQICNSSAFPDEIGWVPKRLLDVGTDKLKLTLTEQTPPTGRYATLSHCWGPDPICCLDATNFDAWQSDIPLDSLTQTFRDAIITTKRMGIRYLWIDSLCILQAGPGSAEDWLEHATAMRSIYKNSIVNIAVARASCGEEGAFATRSPTFVRPCHFQWRQRRYYTHNDPVMSSFIAEAVAVANGGPIPARLTEAKLRQGFLQGVTVPHDEPGPIWTIRSVFRHSSSALRMLPLYTRAWVVQERFLAPRVLHFGEDRIMWECRETGFVEESCPDGIPDYIGPDWKPNQWPFNVEDSHDDGQPGTTAAHDKRDPTRELWYHMVDEFTRCDLSFPDKDIFVAFAGIAEVFGQHYDHRYVAGFFRQHLPFALWWRTKGTRSLTTRAPSWSWASIDGAVETVIVDDCLPCERCCTPLADVEDVKIGLLDDRNVYGQIRGAELTLRGWLIPCKIERLRKGGTGLAQTVALFPALGPDDPPPSRYTSGATTHYRGDDPALVMGDSQLDEEEESQRGSDLATRGVFDRWALPLFLAKETKVGLKSEKCRYFGLLVKRNDDGKYVRTGLYSVWIKQEKDVLAERPPSRDICLV